MNEPGEFDEQLAARFGQEHSHVAGDAFVAGTLRKVRAESRRREVLRIGRRGAALAAIVVASPWLIAGVERLNALLGSAHGVASGMPVALLLGVLAVVVVLVAASARRR